MPVNRHWSTNVIFKKRAQRSCGCVLASSGGGNWVPSQQGQTIDLKISYATTLHII